MTPAGNFHVSSGCRAEKQPEQCAVSQRGLYPDESICFLGGVIKEDNVLGGPGVPTCGMGDLMKYNVKLCKVKRY